MSQRNNLLLCSQQFVKYKKFKKQQSLQYIHTYNSYTSMETSVVTTIRASNGPWTLEKRRSKEQGFYKPALVLKTPPFFQAPCCYRSKWTVNLTRHYLQSRGCRQDFMNMEIMSPCATQ